MFIDDTTKKELKYTKSILVHCIIMHILFRYSIIILPAPNPHPNVQQQLTALHLSIFPVSHESTIVKLATTKN